LIIQKKLTVFKWLEHVDLPIDLSPTCQHHTSPSGVISTSIQPNIVGLNNTKSDRKEGPATLLISAKSNQVIWLDFSKLSEAKRTIVKVINC